MMARSRRSSAINRLTPGSPKRKRLLNRIPQSPAPDPLSCAMRPSGAAGLDEAAIPAGFEFSVIGRRGGPLLAGINHSARLVH